MNTDHLTAEQLEMLQEVRRRHTENGWPAHVTLLAVDGSPQDRAAVAETLTPGAGSGYLR